MNRTRLTTKFFSGGAAVAIGLWLTSAGAATPGPISPARPAGAAAGSTHLMPVVPVSSKIPTSSEEDIRDIRQPRHLPTRWPWVAAAAGIAVLGGSILLGRSWLRHGKFFKMRPHEIALQHLADARRLMDPDQAREYCFEVSRIVRRYIEERFWLQAPQLTTEEFIRELVEAKEDMLATHRALLGNFLEHCDLAKFAGWRYCRPDLQAMHASAENFVTQTAVMDADENRPDPCGADTGNPDDALPPGLPRANTV
jgi:hypothetical protein